MKITVGQFKKIGEIILSVLVQIVGIIIGILILKTVLSLIIPF